MKVLSVTDGAKESIPWWTIIAVEGREGKFTVFHNWEALHGDLKVGDEVEFELAKVPTYSQCQYSFVSGLRRIPKDEVAADV